MSGKLVLAAAGLAGAFLLHHLDRERKDDAVKRTRQRRRIRRTQQSNRGTEVALTASTGQPEASSSRVPSAGATARRRLLLPSLLMMIVSAALAACGKMLHPTVLEVQDWQHWTTALASLLALLGAALALPSVLRYPPSVPAAAPHQAAAQPAPAAAAAAAPAPHQDVSGVWAKCKAESDSMEEACDVMHIGGLVRAAIGLIKGVELAVDEAAGEFRMSVLSGILWFKITERYPLDGSSRQFRRRDLRRGRHTGSVARCPATGGILLTVAWDPPFGGVGTDHFHLVSPEVLHVDTSMVVDGRPVKYRTVYRRKAAQ